MSQLTRKLQSIFGLNAPSGEVGVIGSKAGGSSSTSKDLETLQANARYLLGYFETTSDQGTTKLPYTEEQNAIDFILTSQLKYLFQNGIPEYLATEDYYPDVSFCQDEGVIWVVKSDSASPTTGFKPSTNQDKWDPVAGSNQTETISSSDALAAGWFKEMVTFLDTSSGAVDITSIPDGNFRGQKRTIITDGTNQGAVQSFTGKIPTGDIPITDEKALHLEWDGSKWGSLDELTAEYVADTFYTMLQRSNGRIKMLNKRPYTFTASATRVADLTWPITLADTPESITTSGGQIASTAFINAFITSDGSATGVSRTLQTSLGASVTGTTDDVSCVIEGRY